MANALVPELAVRDCARSRRFYCDTLGFSVAYSRPEEGFAYLTLGEEDLRAELMIDQIGQGRTFGKGHLPEAYPFGRGLNLQIEVADIAPLLAALATVDHPLFLEPEDKWYRRDDTELGNRQFMVADPDGYLLRFFQDLGTRPISHASVCMPVL